MNLGKVHPIPEDGDLSHYCPFDSLVIGDYFPIIGFTGSCPNCKTGAYPQEFLCEYLKDDDIYHVFRPIEEVRCQTCKGLVAGVSLICGKSVVDVTQEFEMLKK